jgi:phosphoribosylanthranilate isomerase
MKIKVCGLKEPDNINAVASLAPDYMGFICFDRSPRFIGDLPFEILDRLPSSIKKTAVFVDESESKINQLTEAYGFDAIQLHGDESPDFCNSFKSKVEVIKAFGLHPGFDFDKLDAYNGKVDFFLFDTKTELHGGSGKAFDWNILDKYNLNVPFFLSGGLGLENLEAVKNIDHPQFYGVDLNSRFETSAGIKDVEKLTKAFELIKRSYVNELRS